MAVRRAAHVACFAAGVLAAVPAVAQDGVGLGIGQYGPSVLPVGREPVGQTITRVDIEIAVSSGDADRDAEARRAARAATSGLVGRSYRPLLVDTALGVLADRGIAQQATHRPVLDGARGTLGIVVALDLTPTRAEPPEVPSAPGFPVIHQDDRSKLTFILSAGIGVYSDINSWFGAPELFNARNPLAGNLPGGQTTWGEGYAEIGIGGATQIGAAPLFAFGAVSGLYSFSRGQDVFTDEDRDFVQVEKGYAGLLYADADSGNSAQLSFGRQTWTLNNGFLISMIAGSTSAGERGATYLGPRIATDFSALFTGEFGRTRFALFYIDPNELEDLESNTTFAGVNLGYSFTDALSADVSVITIPTSDSTFATPSGAARAREGITTYGLHGLYRPTAPDHAWLEAEAYHQTNDAYAMSAQAGYATVGYIYGSAPWEPSLSYRIAHFTGDDPDTDRFERFDPLMSSGLGNWLQGLSFGKVYRNANLTTHRLQANVAPRPGMNVTLTYHRLIADERNNLGGNPALSQLNSRDLGDELTAALRWAVDRNTLVQVVASRAWPGRALRDIGADEPWTTLQATLYLSF